MRPWASSRLRAWVHGHPTRRRFAIAASGALLAVLGLMVAPHVASAPTEGPAEVQHARELRELRARLRELQLELDQSVGARDAERQRLRTLDQRIADVVRELHEIDTRLDEQRRRLRALEQRRGSLHTALAEQRRDLEQELRAAYVLGRQPHLKLLLNQQRPDTVSRMLVYYRYLNGARLRAIERARTALERLRTVEQQIAERNRELLSLRDAQAERRQAREGARRERAQVLATLERRVRDQSAEIARLREDEKRLQRLLERLQDYLVDVPPTPHTRFGEARGKLPLPTNGRVRVRFGEPRAGGGLRSKGVFLSAAEGQEVISVARGRVAFADWLRGFGLLLILEHGDGYMTLYGHNQSLYVQVGDWVEGGQVIAAAGSTGDAPESGVYFEIRQQGQPRDPLQWCRLP